MPPASWLELERTGTVQASASHTVIIFELAGPKVEVGAFGGHSLFVILMQAQAEYLIGCRRHHWAPPGAIPVCCSIRTSMSLVYPQYT